MCVLTFVVSIAGFTPSWTQIQQTSLSPKDSALFYAHVADKVRRDYVENVDNNKLLEGALDGMLSSLDRYSSYLSPKKYQEVRKQAHGEYGGVGLEITYEEGALKIVSPIEDTPAQKGGLLPGDLIVAIDGKPIYDMTSYEASQALRGEPESAVTLSVRRLGMPSFDVRLVRERIRVIPVKGRLYESMGYVRITTFNERTTEALKETLENLMAKAGPKCGGFVLDLRNNPGGLFEQAVSVCELLMDQGNIVSIRGRDAKKDLSFSAQEHDVTKGLPLVVLINGGSASSSEIVAGALQDNKRAVVVGTKSFGKASVQTVVPMTNGGAIKLTTAYYYTPKGRSIQKTGIVPDIKIEQQGTSFKSEDKKGVGCTKEKAPVQDRELCMSGEKETSGDKDLQLTQALNVLRTLSLGRNDPPNAPQGGVRVPV